ncbi:MAG: hypothetical protein ACLSGF_07740 [Alistipes onderdonkii]
MKSLLLLAATICCACCSCVQPKHYPDYSVSSGFALDSLDARDPQVIENLGVTCRVWGYVKYHHPVFADSTLNVDYELFGLLPQVAKATPAKRNKVLSEWVKGLGRFSTDKAEYDEALKTVKCTRTADLLWMDDTARLGNVLPRLLRELRYAKREANRYTDFTANAGNFVMRNESTAGSSDDCGYRMLFLFRFWNVIEYFSPTGTLPTPRGTKSRKNTFRFSYPGKHPATRTKPCSCGSCAIRIQPRSDTICLVTTPFRRRCATPMTGSS